ncbi:MAG: restriction endonuclease [Anaerolineales bacterium]|nr:restriction endonuclease [Anaerolineales bacterium]
METLAEQLYALTPKEFEHAVAELFRAQGYQAIVSGGRNDRGVAIHLKRDGQKAAVQCKRYKQPITPAQIREFAGAMGEAAADHGYFVTTSSFTRMARAAAKNSSVTIQLIDAAALGQRAGQIGWSWAKCGVKIAAWFSFFATNGSRIKG